MSRERLSKILGEGVEVRWGKSFFGFSGDGEGDERGVTVAFEDGTSVRGRLVIGCDGSHSRVRRALLPAPAQHENTPVPVRLYGFTMRKRVDKTTVMRKLDPFVVTGTGSENNSFTFLSVMDGPGENEQYPDDYVYAVCISRPLTEEEQQQEVKKGREKQENGIGIAPTADEKTAAVEKIAYVWEEPFRSFILTSMPHGSKIKQLDLDDFLPPSPFPHSDLSARATLMGDALHTMTMYRGEGANHVIVDVQDFEEHVIPALKKEDTKEIVIHEALRAYEAAVVQRVRPAVLASRQACLDAHNWGRLIDESLGPSPLLTKREMFVSFP